MVLDAERFTGDYAMRPPILALTAAAFLSASGFAYAQTTAPDQNTREQTKDQMQQPGTRAGPDEMKPGGGSEQNMRSTQMQGTERDQMQGGERPQGGQMLRGGEERGEGARPLTVQQKTT